MLIEANRLIEMEWYRDALVLQGYLTEYEAFWFILLI